MLTGSVMRQFNRNLHALFAVAILAASAATADAGGSGTSANPNGLKSSSGGTGMSKGAGNGGTGIPTNANAPLANIQPTFKPAHAAAPPPAGVRPHTDLAAAEKRTDLSSRSIVKRSSLYPELHAPPVDPRLIGPTLPHMETVGGSASFKAVGGFNAELSKGNVYPTNGGRDSGGHPTASLSSNGAGAIFAAVTDGEESAAGRSAEQGWLGRWLVTLAALGGALGVGAWLWRQMPKTPRIRLPAPA